MPSLKLEGDEAGAELFYQCLGDKAASPVIMIHGLLLGNSATWYFGAASALAKSHRVIVYDLRGHGMSAKAASGYDLKTMRNDLKSLIDSQGFEKVSLVGHSYGALIALEFAREFPDLCEKLVLVEGPLPPARGLQMDAFLNLSPDQQAEALPPEMQDALAKGSRQARKLLDRLNFLCTETELLQKLREEDDISDEQLADLKIPTQLIYGSESQLVDVATRLDRTLPRANLTWLEGGHYLPSEKSQELSTIIGGFFQ